MDKKIGIIGGMGPMASQLFYKMVTEMTEAEKDQEHLNLIMISDASMPDRTSAILKKDYEEVAQKMEEDALLLQHCGCCAIGVTCNTAHFFVDMIEEKLSIPFIHMIKETVSQISQIAPGGKIAVLATDGTVQTGIYQQRLAENGLIPYIPQPEIQKEVMHQIYDCIKKGKPYDANSWDKIQKAIQKEGCQKAILGCTELSVIGAQQDLGEDYIDPMKILAKRVIEFSGKNIRQDRRA